ncbi:MAG: hypothetical protein AAGK67_16180 [Pseudomonadota bacterium]
MREVDCYGVKMDICRYSGSIWLDHRDSEKITLPIWKKLFLMAASPMTALRAMSVVTRAQLRAAEAPEGTQTRQ